MTTEWSHLPNAAHIDRVLSSLKAHHEAWDAAGEAPRPSGLQAAWTAAREACSETARREEAWCSAFSATATSPIGWSSINRVPPSGAILALIAWDNSAKFFDMTSNELEFWAVLSKDSAAILLLPAVIAFEQIKELELT